MRVTQPMIYSSMIANISNAADRVFVTQNEAASGKRISRATDDPAGAARAMALRSSLDAIDQYGRNIDQAKGQLSQTDTSLGTVSQAVAEVKRLGLIGANGTTGLPNQQALADQVQAQVDLVVKEMNSTYLGRSLFGGFQTRTPVVAAPANGATPYQYQGDDGVAVTQVGESAQVPTSVTARQVLNFDGTADPSQPDLLSIMEGLKHDLTAGDPQAIQGRLQQLDAASQRITSLRGTVGTRATQVQIYSDRLNETKVTVSASLSKVEDADMTDTLSRLQAEQNAYQASLIATSRALQSNLADYLK